VSLLWVEADAFVVGAGGRPPDGVKVVWA